MNKIEEASNCLADGRDYRLATLISGSLGGDLVVRQEMRDQIDEWRKHNVLSEMSEPIRALYELIAGNTCVCEGKKGPIEDRASKFVISQRFEMDWKRAFGLKLWFGILPEESLEEAVKAFKADLDSGNEQARPLPTNTSTWNDPTPDQRTDPLYSILTLISEKSQPAARTKLAIALMPQNITGSPTSHRLSFELYHCLARHFRTATSPAHSDALTAAFAAELEAAGDWQWALFTYLFLDEPTQRKEAVRDLLARCAPEIDETDDAHLGFVFRSCKVPESWLWEAKALHARSLLAADGAAATAKEVEFLAKAHAWSEAHRVLCEQVAPLCVIERDTAGLRALLDALPAKQIPEWRVGGQVYADYIVVSERFRGAAVGAPERGVLARRLLEGLREMAAKPGNRRRRGFVEVVAAGEMARVVAGMEMVKEESGPDLMGLPLTSDVRREIAVDVGLKYYGAVMAG